MPGYSKLFRSRWWALLWAGGIIWTAVTVWAPDDQTQATGGNMEIIAQALPR
jgi:hypothetical protein